MNASHASFPYPLPFRLSVNVVLNWLSGSRSRSSSLCRKKKRETPNLPMQRNDDLTGAAAALMCAPCRPCQCPHTNVHRPSRDHEHKYEIRGKKDDSGGKQQPKLAQLLQLAASLLVSLSSPRRFCASSTVVGVGSPALTAATAPFLLFRLLLPPLTTIMSILLRAVAVIVVVTVIIIVIIPTCQAVG